MMPRTTEEFRIYAGYAGWAAGQLEREIGRGDWYLLPADAALIFRRDMTKLWPELFRKSREIAL
jgi:putative transcriptional regulator